LLPFYKKYHSNDHIFLPYITKYVNALETIIDIGVNGGDSLAAMVKQNTHSNYICIEADMVFYKPLKKLDCHETD
jgi:tRNA G46 methylase TrmB